MHKSLIITLLASSGMVLSTAVVAGNYPNTAHTTTRTIGSGTYSSRVPQSLPGTRTSHYSSRSQGRFDISTANYANRFAHRPDDTYPSYPPGVPAVSGKPAAFPGSDAIAAHAGATPAVSKTQFTGGFPPAAGSAQLPGAANQPSTPIYGMVAAPGIINTGVTGTITPPTPASVSLPGGSVTTGIPATVSTGSGVPSTLPPALPAAATGNLNRVDQNHLPSQATGSAFNGLDMRPSGVGAP